MRCISGRSRFSRKYKKIRLMNCTNILLANSVELNLILPKFARPSLLFIYFYLAFWLFLGSFGSKFLNSVVPSHCETQPYDK